MAKKFSTFKEKPQRLIPVPLHRKRYHQRGFNQAIEIAQPISRQLNIPLDTRCCLRRVDTTAQAELHADERRKNIRGAFQVRHHINYKHVAIIDDVVTTGATVNELAKMLRKEGVTKIEVWCCARA